MLLVLGEFFPGLTVDPTAATTLPPVPVDTVPVTTAPKATTTTVPSPGQDC